MSAEVFAGMEDLQVLRGAIERGNRLAYMNDNFAERGVFDAAMAALDRAEERDRRYRVLLGEVAPGGFAAEQGPTQDVVDLVTEALDVEWEFDAAS
ncbi:MAG: hypothetical protein H0U46_10895 [Actinobacteria bacterium]|nr:hypothetical protein [Actinomycetota bacterium]